MGVILLALLGPPLLCLGWYRLWRRLWPDAFVSESKTCHPDRNHQQRSERKN